MHCARWSLRWALVLALGGWTTPVAAQTPAAQPFTLAEALARALEVDPERAAIRARLEAARLASDQAGRLPNPVFEFRQENYFSGVSRDQLPLDTFAEVTQLIEIGGKRGARRRVAESAASLEDAADHVARVQLTRAIVGAYLEAVRQRERQQTLRQQATDLAETVRVMGRRVALGTAAEADLLRLRTEEARSSLELTRSEVAAARAHAELGARLGFDPPIEALELPIVPSPSIGGPAPDLSGRPDMILGTRRVEAARQVLGLEDARAVPDPSVNGGLKRTVGLNTAQFTVTMPLPLFNHNNASRAIASGAVKAAEQDLLATERRARGELQASSEAARQLSARTRDVRATLLDPARAARDAARAAYRAGALDVLRLVDAERLATEAALVATELEVEAVASAIAARLAAGEGPLP